MCGDHLLLESMNNEVKLQFDLYLYMSYYPKLVILISYCDDSNLQILI